MRYATVLKFIAVILCAATLLGAVGSAVGIVCLTELGGKSVNEAYEDQLRSQSIGYAMSVGEIYAAEELGGVPQNLLNQYYSSDWENQYFVWNRVGYTLYDSEGNAIQEQEMYNGEDVEYTFEDLPVIGTYMKVVSLTPRDEYFVSESSSGAEEGIQVLVMPSQESTAIHAVYVDYTDGTQMEWPEDEDGTQIGGLYYTDGTLIFHSNFGAIPEGDGWYPNHIIMMDSGGNVVYEVIGDEYVILSSVLGTAYQYQLPVAAVTTAAPVGVTYTEGHFTAYDAIPTQGVTVQQMNVTYSDREGEALGSEGIASPDLIGTIFHDYLGNAEFHSTDPMTMDIPEDSIITAISFIDAQNNLIYEANCSGGVGTIEYDENGYLVFRGQLPGVEVPEETAAVEEVAATEAPEALEGQLGFAMEELPIYSAPSVDAEKVGAVNAWQEISVVKQERFNGQQWGLIPGGWISLDRVLLEDTENESFESYTTSAETDLNVYSTTTTETVLGSIKKGETFQVLRQEEIDGRVWALTDTGWVILEDAIQTAAAAGEERNIYASPNPSANVLGTLEAGAEPEILQQDTYNGVAWGLTREGWILLTESELAAAAMPAVASEIIPEAPAVPEAPEAPALPETVEATEETMVAAAAAEALEETVAATIATEAAEETVVPTEPVAAYAKSDDSYSVEAYWDDEQQQSMVAEYELATIPDGYTVTVRLAKGALRNEFAWTLLRLAEVFRYILVEMLGICIAVFVLCVVYICCAAGHSRRSSEVKAGGLNRIPLDLYFVTDCCLVCALVGLAMFGCQYFASRNEQELAIILMGACSYLSALLVVGFFFAFVAQIKTPGGFWWRNSFCGWCLRLLVLFSHGLADLGEKAWTRGVPMTGKLFRWLGQTCRELWTVAKKTILWGWDVAKKTTLWVWDTAKRFGTWAGTMIGNCSSWIMAKLALFFGLLPITWQFLLTGFVLVFLLYIMMRTYKVGYILLGFGIFFAVILYAASAFAILLESAKKMSKGDLDTKVDDRLLIGGFKDFAGELNDLADVAVIAAQKQLKSERMKTELITNVSHDIKTPLTSIINYVDLLQKPHTEAQQEQYLEVLDRQSQRLKKLIEDLMEMSKASTGNMAVDIEKVDAAEAVNQALGEFADKLEKAQLTPVFRQPDDSVYMMADGRLVWRVMSNLLGNAVKYALPGTRVYLDLLEMDGKVIISMKNISREELNVSADELMERFVRGDASRNTEGSGLGLNIAQSLMELQKGQLQILVDGDLFKVTMVFPSA